MYKSYWEMEFNPFEKEQKGRDYYEGYDMKEAVKRLEYLQKIRGIGLFTGEPGYGKTTAVRSFVGNLSSVLYRTVYIPMTTVKVNEFYRDLAVSLGLEPSHRKTDNFRQIQECISGMYRDRRVTPVLWIDEAQYLHQSILADLQLLMNFEMDSRNYAVMILSGLPALGSRLAMRINEPLKQRIVMNYIFQGLSAEETEDYIKSRLQLCGVKREIMDASALEALKNCCGGSIRKLDGIMHKALMIRCSMKKEMVDREVIMEAVSETEPV